jgi:hypothetical protein
MKTIKLTQNGKDLIVNWANVQFAREAEDTYQNAFVEVFFNRHECVRVEQSLQDIELLLLNKNPNHF